LKYSSNKDEQIPYNLHLVTFVERKHLAVKANLKWNNTKDLLFKRTSSKQQIKAQLLVLFYENYVYNYTTVTVTKRLFSFVNQGMDGEIKKKICSKCCKRVCLGVRKSAL